jgi:site-specific recombinase XerD
VPKPTKYVARDGAVTYKVRFRLGGRRGKQCQETFDTLREAKAFCSDINTRDASYALRVLHQSEAERTDALDKIAEDFFEWKATRVRSDRTVADYRRDYTNWIAPTFGTRWAGSIVEADVQAWVDTMGAALSPKSVRDRHALLHGIYKWAMHPQRHRVDHNPCEGTDLPHKQKGMPKGLQPMEWEALYAALRQIDPDAADVAEAMLATGWRWSEVTGMAAWQVQDMGAHTGLWVSMEQVARRDSKGRTVLVAEGKGQASVRRVRVDDAAAAMFRRRVVGKAPADLVFTTGISPQNGLGGSQWNYSNFRHRAWDKAVTVANLGRKPSPHWLRHTHVVWMAMTGASLPELQARIGHASITTTIDVYGRMLTDVKPEALEGFAAMRAPRQIEG